MPEESYSCDNHFHAYNFDSIRDQYYRTSVERWTNCTHARCPNRYISVPLERQIPLERKTHDPPTKTQEAVIKKVHGGRQPALKPTPASPQISKGALPIASTSRKVSRPPSRTGTPRISTPQPVRPETEEQVKNEPPESSLGVTWDPSVTGGEFTEEPTEQPMTTTQLLPTETQHETILSTQRVSTSPVRDQPPHLERNSPTESESGEYLSGDQWEGGGHRTPRLSRNPRTSESANPLFGPITPGQSVSASLGSLSVPARTSSGIPNTPRPPWAPSGGPSGPSYPRGGGGPGDPGDNGGSGGPGEPGGGRRHEGGGGPQGPGDPQGPGGPPGGPFPPQPPQPQAQAQAPSQGKGKIRDPTIFTGDREQTQTFLNSLFLLFFGRPNDFSNDAVKISSALSYMEGSEVEAFKESIILNAQGLDPYTGRQRGFGSWNDFEQLFRTTFAPINEVDNAIMELGSIQYNNYKTPDDFHARFLKLLLVCRVTEPLVQISYYRAALNDTLRNRLANSYPMPVTLEQYMTRVLEMDHAWRANRHLSQLQRKGRTTGNTDKTARATETTGQGENQTNKLSLAKRQELRRKGLCFFCQKEGHLARDCPNRKQDQSKPRFQKNTSGQSRTNFQRNVRQTESKEPDKQSQEVPESEEELNEDEIHHVDLVTSEPLQNFQ